VLTALGERDALVRDAERRAGQALRTMIDEEGLSLREAVDWCGSGLSVREITRLLRLDGFHQGGQDDYAARYTAGATRFLCLMARRDIRAFGRVG